MKAQLVKRQDRFDLYNESDGSKIASTLPNPMGKLSIANCEAIENGYDLDELFDEVDESIDYQEFDFSSFKLGFKKALEILGDKKFSEEDLRIGCSSLLNLEKEEGELSEVFTEKQYRHIDNYIQSLQHVEWDVEIVMEKVKDETKIIGSVKGVKGSGHKITTYKSVPVFDVDGCLILKRK